MMSSRVAGILNSFVFPFNTLLYRATTGVKTAGMCHTEWGECFYGSRDCALKN